MSFSVSGKLRYKAFNSVDPEVLIHKLFKMNFSKSFLHWLASYLTDRKQYVQVNDKLSRELLYDLGFHKDPYLVLYYLICM